MKKKTTIRDIARMANLSTGTVSKYFNEPERVKDKNREIIKKCIQELDYTPNMLAQRLATGKSNVILLYMIMESAIHASTWLHQLPIIQTLNDYLRDTDFNLHIKIDSVEKMQEVGSYIEHNMASKNIDGAIIYSSWTLRNDDVELLKKNDFPFVLIDNDSPILKKNSVICDNEKMVVDLMEYLIERNHKKIAFIHEQSGHQDMKDRYNGYLKALKRNAIKKEEHWVLYGDFSIESGVKCVSKMIKKGNLPSAIVCGNDNMAVGAIKAIHSAGLSVPCDISVVGIDDSIVARAIKPTLTTMKIPMEKMTLYAVKSLLNKIRNSNYEVKKKVFYGELIEGESVSFCHNS